MLSRGDGILLALVALTRNAANGAGPGRIEFVEVLPKNVNRFGVLVQTLERQGNFKLNVISKFTLDLERENLLIQREGFQIIWRECIKLIRCGAAGKLVGEIDQHICDRLFTIG